MTGGRLLEEGLRQAIINKLVISGLTSRLRCRLCAMTFLVDLPSLQVANWCLEVIGLKLQILGCLGRKCPDIRGRTSLQEQAKLCQLHLIGLCHLQYCKKEPCCRGSKLEVLAMPELAVTAARALEAHPCVADGCMQEAKSAATVWAVLVPAFDPLVLAAQVHLQPNELAPAVPPCELPRIPQGMLGAPLLWTLPHAAGKNSRAPYTLDLGATAPESSGLGARLVQASMLPL